MGRIIRGSTLLALLVIMTSESLSTSVTQMIRTGLRSLRGGLQLLPAKTFSERLHRCLSLLPFTAYSSRQRFLPVQFTGSSFIIRFTHILCPKNHFVKYFLHQQPYFDVAPIAYDISKSSASSTSFAAEATNLLHGLVA